jgi:hypothetical protein
MDFLPILIFRNPPLLFSNFINTMLLYVQLYTLYIKYIIYFIIQFSMYYCQLLLI